MSANAEATVVNRTTRMVFSLVSILVRKGRPLETVSHNAERAGQEFPAMSQSSIVGRSAIAADRSAQSGPLGPSPTGGPAMAGGLVPQR
jgi:hypothetical protein